MKKSAVLVIFALLLSVMTNVCAASITDIGSHWAKDTIESMVEIGIIKGYDDGTFKPEQAVSKTEGLILLSRVCGFTDESSEQFADVASDTYKSALSACSTAYKNEISYLLYLGVLNESDILTFAADSVAKEPLKRYEAAELLAKTLGASNTYSAASLSKFTDTGDIPAAGKPYVAYVCDNSIMNGMTDTTFGPMVNVTRAQIATLLYRMIPVLNYSYDTGTLANYESGIFKIKDASGNASSYNISSSVKTILDGKKAVPADIPVGASVRVTYSGTDIVCVEGISPDVEETVSGVFVSSSKVTDATIINIKNPLTEEKVQYTLADVYNVDKNGSSSSLANLSANDYVTISISKNKVFKISASNKVSTVSGKVTDITLSPKLLFEIDGKNEYTTYDSVYVKRNGKSVTLSDVLVGDKVDMTLEYGYVSEIIASSASSTASGYIQQLVISATPSVVVKINGEDTEYSLLRDVAISRNGSDAEVYDIRVGDYATVGIEGGTVTKITLSSSTVSGGSITGTVKYINSSYGYITLEENDIYIFTSKAKVQNSAGSTVTLKSINTGSSVTVFGTESSGSYVASLIVVN